MLAIVYIWKFVEIAYFKSADKEAIRREIAIDSVQKTPYLLFFALFVFVIANIYFGVDSYLSVDIANAIAHDFFAR